MSLWLLQYFMVFDFSQNFSGVVKRVQSSGAQIENHSVFKTRRVTWNTQQQITFYRLKKPRKSGFLKSKISVSYLRHNLKAFCHQIEIWKIYFNDYLLGFKKDLMRLILIFDVIIRENNFFSFVLEINMWWEGVLPWRIFSHGNGNWKMAFFNLLFLWYRARKRWNDLGHTPDRRPSAGRT